MLGFGLLGAATSTVVRRKRDDAVTTDDPISDNLSNLLLSGVSAALATYLAVKGGLAVVSSEGALPNSYLLLLTCFVAAVYWEEAWVRVKALVSKGTSEAEEAAKKAAALKAEQEAAALKAAQEAAALKAAQEAAALKAAQEAAALKAEQEAAALRTPEEAAAHRAAKEAELKAAEQAALEAQLEAGQEDAPDATRMGGLEGIPVVSDELEDAPAGDPDAERDAAPPNPPPAVG